MGSRTVSTTAPNGRTEARLGIALGSGSARGWSHIGVLRALEREGVRPQVVAGCSIGAVVGAAYAAGRLDALEDWARSMSRWEVLRFLEIGGSGLIDGERWLGAFERRVRDRPIAELQCTFGAVATDLITGQEVWLREGSLTRAVRASIALPGVLAPERLGERWLLDGGLVDPVPVTLCRALGADLVLGVNLNSYLVGRHMRPRNDARGETSLLQQLRRRFRGEAGEQADADTGTATEEDVPGLFEVLGQALNVMQDRITRSRMAGEPPDLMLIPRLSDIMLMEFDRADEAITEGAATVGRNLPAIMDLLGRACIVPGTTGGHG